MSNSEDSSGTGTGTATTMSGSNNSTPRKTSAQDTAALRSTPVVDWSIQQVAAFFQMHGIDDAVVQKAASEMITGADLLGLENVSFEEKKCKNVNNFFSSFFLFFFLFGQEDLRELGVTKMGPRKKLLTRINKLNQRGASALDESSTTQGDGTDDESSDAGTVKITAMFKKKKTQLTVGAHITLESLLLRLSEAFGCRVKVKLEDDEGDQIAINDDQELTDALVGEDSVVLQAFKDLKWRANTGAKKGSAAPSAKSSASSMSDAVSDYAGKYVMFDELLDPYVVIDGEGTVLAFNPSAEKLFGYSKKKVLGKNIKMLMPDTYAKKHDTYLAKYARTGIKTVVDSKRVVMGKAASGEMIAIELGITEKEVGDGSHFVACLRRANAGGDDDSSAGGSTAAGDAVLDVKIPSKLRKNMMALQEAAIIITAEGRICVFNKAAEALFGHAASAVVGGPIEVLMGSPHKCNHAYYLQRYVATGEARVMGSSRNVQAKHKNGQSLEVNLALSESETDDGEQIFIGLLTAVKQIQHHKTGSATAKAGSLLQTARLMISGMMVPAIIINDTGVIQAFNREAEKVLGYQLIDVVGRNVTMIMNGDDAAKHAQYLARYKASGHSDIIGAGKGRTVVAKHKSGKLMDMHLSIVEQEDEAGTKIFTGMLHQTKTDLAAAKSKRKSSKKSSKSSKMDDE
jgi:PAS domain S-box-containing protein